MGRAMSRPKKKAPKQAKVRFDVSDMTFTMCALDGYSECDEGLVMPFTTIETRGLKELAKPLVIGLCPRHRVIVSRDSTLAQRLGFRVPRWVWNKATFGEQKAYIIETMKVLRSTARANGAGKLTDEQWPFWMENEKLASIRDREFRELVDGHNRRVDDATWGRQQAAYARRAEERAMAAMTPDTPFTVTNVRHAEDGTHVVVELADGRTVVGFDPTS